MRQTTPGPHRHPDPGLTDAAEFRPRLRQRRRAGMIFAGMCIAATVFGILMLVVLLATMLLYGVPIHASLCQAIELMFIELLVVTAMADVLPDVPVRATRTMEEVFAQVTIPPPAAKPTDPLDEWVRPPFEPRYEDDIVYARGTGDDKGQLYMHLKAAEAWLQGAGGLPLNVRFFFEGDEEVGSEPVEQFIAEHADLLRADVCVVSDGDTFDDDGTPAIGYGLRGIAYWEVRVHGPRQDVHSGQYGGGVDNPGNVLVRMLASLTDADGRVTVPGFYDRVRDLTDDERKAIKDYRREASKQGFRSEPLERDGAVRLGHAGPRRRRPPCAPPPESPRGIGHLARSAISRRRRASSTSTPPSWIRSTGCPGGWAAT